MSLCISERAGWIPDFGDLTFNLAAQYGWVYGLSVTEMEIVHGAFRKLNPNGMFVVFLFYVSFHFSFFLFEEEEILYSRLREFSFYWFGHFMKVSLRDVIHIQLIFIIWNNFFSVGFSVYIGVRFFEYPLVREWGFFYH